MTSRKVIELTNVTRSFCTPAGNVEVLKGIDLAVSEGDFLVITGPSGSGKSTLLHICALIDQPSSGNVTMRGTDMSKLTDEELCRIRKQEIGLVFQRFCLLPHRNVLDNVLFRFRYLRAAPADTLSLAREAIEQMGLEDVAQRQARLLSSGEQQRTAIARAVARRPALLLADEPTGNLDTAAAEAVMDCFKSLNRDGITIIMVTHNERLLEYASRHITCTGGALQERQLT